MASPQTRPRSGWVTFAAVLVLLGGVYNVLWGYNALDKKKGLSESAILVIGDSLDFWGWFFLIIGVLMVLTAILLFMRRAGGVILVGIGATTSALIAFFALLANTDQALIIIALDLLILWAVFAHVDDFE